MGTTPGTNAHTNPNTAPAREPAIGQHTQPLSAAEFLARQRASIEADAAAGAVTKITGKSIDPRFTEPKVLEAARGAIEGAQEFLGRLVSGQWTASIREHESSRASDLISSISDQGLLAPGDSIVVIDLGYSQSRHELAVYDKVLPSLFREYRSGYDSTALSVGLAAVKRALGTQNLQHLIQSKKPIFAGAIQALDKLGYDLSPDGQEANRKATIDTAVAAAVQRYGSSDECRALKLLALIDDRARGVAVDDNAVQRMIRNLQTLGAEGTQELLIGLAPALKVEASHLRTLMELFTSYTADPVSTSSRREAASGASGKIETSSAVATSHVIPAVIEANYDPEWVALILQEELGMRDHAAVQKLAQVISVERLEAVQTTLNQLPPGMVSAVLNHNPNLLHRDTEVNLASYAADFSEFLRIGYQYTRRPQFNPEKTPGNFSTHENLRATLKALKADLHRRA